MDPQLNLFEKATLPWVERLWERVGAEQREAVLAVLAQMGARRLERSSSTPTKETVDES